MRVLKVSEFFQPEERKAWKNQEVPDLLAYLSQYRFPPGSFMEKFMDSLNYQRVVSYGELSDKQFRILCQAAGVRHYPFTTLKILGKMILNKKYLYVEFSKLRSYNEVLYMDIPFMENTEIKIIGCRDIEAKDAAAQVECEFTDGRVQWKSRNEIDGLFFVRGDKFINLRNIKNLEEDEGRRKPEEEDDF